MVWPYGHELGRNIIGRLVTKKSEEGTYEWISSEFAHTIRIFMPIGIPPQRVSTAKEVLNNQVDQTMHEC